MKTKSFKNAIALTGGIATGKSTVCDMLRSKGYEIIDADKVAHNMLDLHSKDIATMFGDEYVIDGKVDRKKLGSIIFNNTNNRKKLEEFLHPLIREEIVAQADIYEGKKTPYIVDIPLYYESGKYDIDRVALVYAPKQIQLKRLLQRDHLTDVEANQRLDSQLPIEEKREKCSFIIDNTKDLTHLKEEVEKFIKDIDASY
jgi:dephospho-CoA kinase